MGRLFRRWKPFWRPLTPGRRPQCEVGGSRMRPTCLKTFPFLPRTSALLRRFLRLLCLPRRMRGTRRRMGAWLRRTHLRGPPSRCVMVVVVPCRGRSPPKKKKKKENAPPKVATIPTTTRHPCSCPPFPSLERFQTGRTRCLPGRPQRGKTNAAETHGREGQQWRRNRHRHYWIGATVVKQRRARTAFGSRRVRTTTTTPSPIVPRHKQSVRRVVLFFRAP